MAYSLYGVTYNSSGNLNHGGAINVVKLNGKNVDDLVSEVALHDSELKRLAVLDNTLLAELDAVTPLQWDILQELDQKLQTIANVQFGALTITYSASVGGSLTVTGDINCGNVNGVDVNLLKTDSDNNTANISTNTTNITTNATNIASNTARLDAVTPAQWGIVQELDQKLQTIANVQFGTLTITYSASVGGSLTVTGDISCGNVNGVDVNLLKTDSDNNTANIATNTANIATNTTNIATNRTDIDGMLNGNHPNQSVNTNASPTFANLTLDDGSGTSHLEVKGTATTRSALIAVNATGAFPDAPAAWTSQTNRLVAAGTGTTDRAYACVLDSTIDAVRIYALNPSVTWLDIHTRGRTLHWYALAGTDMHLTGTELTVSKDVHANADLRADGDVWCQVVHADKTLIAKCTGTATGPPTSGWTSDWSRLAGYTSGGEAAIGFSLNEANRNIYVAAIKPGYWWLSMIHNAEAYRWRVFGNTTDEVSIDSAGLHTRADASVGQNLTVAGTANVTGKLTGSADIESKAQLIGNSLSVTNNAVVGGMVDANSVRVKYDATRTASISVFSTGNLHLTTGAGKAVEVTNDLTIGGNFSAANFSSGIYTPTVRAGSKTSGVTGPSSVYANYTRCGGIVHVDMVLYTVYADSGLSNPFGMDLTLPIQPTVTPQCIGQASSWIPTTKHPINGEVSVNQVSGTYYVQFRCYVSTGLSENLTQISLSFSYRVV